MYVRSVVGKPEDAVEILDLKRERHEGKEEDKPLNFKDHSQLNRKT